MGIGAVERRTTPWMLVHKRPVSRGWRVKGKRQLVEKVKGNSTSAELGGYGGKERSTRQFCACSNNCEIVKLLMYVIAFAFHS